MTPESATSLQAKRDASRQPLEGVSAACLHGDIRAARRHHLTSTTRGPSLRTK